MAAQMRAHDWASTPLGPPEFWPDGLKVPVRIMLTSRFEMWLGWGPDLAFFYNDAYRPTLGDKHPTALGRPTRDVWPEIFDRLVGRFTSVMRDGIATWDKALLLLLERSSFPEETYHTFSYSPLWGDEGRVEGLMCVVSEETERIISERRLETLHAMATSLLSARTRDDVCRGVIAALGTNQQDFPFSWIHMFDEASAETSALANAPWPFESVIADAAPVRIALEGLLDDPPRGAWAVPPTEALLVPILKAGQTRPSGALVLGLNPYRRQDAELQGFAELLAGQIAGVLGTVDALRMEAQEIERLRQLFEQSPSFMAILRGPLHRFELVNPAYAQLVAHRDVVGKMVRDAIPEVEGQGFFELLDRVYQTGQSFTGRAAPITLQTSPSAVPEKRFLDFLYQPIRDAEGVVTGIFVEGIDVTVAHDAVIALRQSEAEFRTLAEAVPNHVWAAQPDGMLDWFNSRVYQYSGAEPGDLLGTGWASIVHPEDRQPTGERWAASLASGETYEAEFRLRRADGTYRWHIARAVPICPNDRTITRWVGTNTDIEDQKQAAQALSDLNATLELQVAERTAELCASEMRLRTIFETSYQHQGLLTPDGIVLDANATLLDSIHSTLKDVVGRPFWETPWFSGTPGMGDIMQRALTAVARGEGFRKEIHLNLPEGGWRWFDLTMRPNRDESGEIISIIPEAVDVTERRRAEEALRQAQKMEAIGHLTGGVAHDFNNLLQVISGNLELLSPTVLGNDRAERRVTNAQVAVNRGSKLASQLLAFGRRQALEPRVVNIGRLVAGMDAILRGAIGEAIEIETIIAAGLWNTLVDPTQIENAILNLGLNGRDAMDGSGKLTIDVCNAYLDDTYAEAHGDIAAGQYVMLAVSDTGIGMPPDIVARVFEPFFSTKPEGRGTGLGLSMVYGFVKQSGGHVKVYSEVGHGSTIKLYLPRAREKEDAIDVEETLPLAGGSETVLVVEDDEHVRGAVVDMLRDLGYRVHTAQEADAALRMLEAGLAPDLLFTDVVMPGPLKSTELAARARQILPAMGILFTSGYTDNAIVHGGRLDAGTELLAKPYTRAALARKIRHVLGSRSAARHAVRPSLPA